MTLLELGNIAGLRLTAHRTAVVGFVLLWAILSGMAIALFNLSPMAAILGGLAATILHFASELWHQLGHAWAARRVGYPMIGVRCWWVLGASIYPKDEPTLPGSVHIRRALGGPAASFLLAMVCGALSLLLIDFVVAEPIRPTFVQKTIWYVIFFLFLDNLLVFTLGAFLPLGFTDGSTILRWWGK